MRDITITVYGLVQGVGFRPFVAEAARELSLSGTVCNIGGIVKIRAVGDEEALDELIRRLSSCTPPGGRVDEVVVGPYDATNPDRAGDCPAEFLIAESEEHRDELRFLPPDIATCEQGERELFDPANRRFRYPFISCVSCGPRMSVMREVPYDRERTTMAEFLLCPACEEDYRRPGDRRRYAQTIGCKACGPRVKLYEGEGGLSEKTVTDQVIRRAVELLKEGKVLAVKDIGGYHFCFDPMCEEAAKRLREYKSRERKPLAVMFRDVDRIREMAEVSATEEKLLESPARPIVLLDKKEGKVFAPSVCGESRRIGAMLPCNPIQLLLLEECKTLVMTSANRGGEPIVTDNERMLLEWKKGFPDAVLTHDREIVNGLDDSIFQVIKVPAGSDLMVSGETTGEEESGGFSDERMSGRTCNETTSDQKEYIQIIRRARGYVPEPIRLPFELKKDCLAAGGDLKAVFALGRKNMAYLSGHFGDLEDRRASVARGHGILRMQELLGIYPERYIIDAHPGYISAKEADIATADRVGHHAAHVASVIVEHGLKGDVLGLAFDGTGYGDDGTVWGSEFLLFHDAAYRRIGCFWPVTMVGGDAASRDVGLSCYAYLYAAWERELLNDDDIRELLERMDACRNASYISDDDRSCVKGYTTVRKAVEGGFGTYLSSSAGRLFDAVAALLGIAYRNTYEGECAERLQAAAEAYLCGEKSAEPDEPVEVWAPVKKHEPESSLPPYTIDTVFLFAGLAHQVLYGEEKEKLAAWFHRAIAEASAELVGKTGEKQIALSGGSMCNRVLLQDLIPLLNSSGRQVYLNEKVPCGDGGLALGQLLFAERED